MTKRARLLYVGAKEDAGFRQELENHLVPLERDGWIEGWHVGRLLPGESRVDRIAREIADAAVVLLLLSADYMSASDCYEIQTKILAERVRRPLLKVIPILVRPVTISTSELAGIEILCVEGKAITQAANLDVAWMSVAQKLRELLAPSVQTAKPLSKALIPLEFSALRKVIKDTVKNDDGLDAFLQEFPQLRNKYNRQVAMDRKITTLFEFVSDLALIRSKLVSFSDNEET